MKELIRTNDPVEISSIMALLAGFEVWAVVFDTDTSIVEGSIGAIQRRIMVADSDFDIACRLLRDYSQTSES